MSIIVVPANRPPERFYQGGQRLAELRGEPGPPAYEPEDWVGSTTTVFGEAPTGLSTLPDGRRLIDAIQEDPQWWLGPEHVAAYGADPMVLAKLLDAGERLPVHAHPTREFAREHLSRPHGKTEAWFLLEGGSLHLGLKQDLELEELAGLLQRQDAQEILALMHRVDVEAGDIVFVPAGMLHAIGGGLLLMELQEPEDLSIMLEWQGYPLDGPTVGHLGMGYDVALQAMERKGRTKAEMTQFVRSAGWGPSVFPAEADTFFRLGRELIDGEVQVDPGFAVLFVVSGEIAVSGSRDGSEAEPVALTRGATAVAPFGMGQLTLAGHGEILVCRPPAPSVP